MEKFSDVQKLKDLVDVASKVKNPRLSGVKIALNDIYEQELFDFGSKTGGPMWDKLRQILDRRNSPNPEPTPEKNDTLYPGPNRDYIDPEDIDLSERWNTPPRPQPYNPLTREEEGGQQALDFDAPQQNTLSDGSTDPSGGPLSPPSAPGALPGASEAPTQGMPSAGEPETAEAVAMDDKLVTLTASLKDYVVYLQENIKAFIKNREMIDKINGVVTMFNGINGTEIPLVEIPVTVPRKRDPTVNNLSENTLFNQQGPALEEVTPNAETAIPKARTRKK